MSFKINRKKRDEATKRMRANAEAAKKADRAARLQRAIKKLGRIDFENDTDPEIQIRILHQYLVDLAAVRRQMLGDYGNLLKPDALRDVDREIENTLEQILEIRLERVKPDPLADRDIDPILENWLNKGKIKVTA